LSDISFVPLSWIKTEVDYALGHARDKLDAFRARPEEFGLIEQSRKHVHEATGAIRVIGLDGLACFSSEMESLLEVADGQTVVIGGLMTDASKKSTDGIPYLSRIPGIGDLFSYRDDQVKKSELVLFLRPTVIRGAGAGQALARAATPLASSAEFLPAGAKP